MSQEDFKGWIHALAATLLAVMAAYNLLQLCTGGADMRHVVNAVIYTPLVPFEWWQTYCHWSGQ